MKITSIGHGTASDNEHIVFCIVDFTKVVVSSAYYDKQEYGIFWFESWVQDQLDQEADTITWFELEWLESMKGFSSITRVEECKQAKAKRALEKYGLASVGSMLSSQKVKQVVRKGVKPQRNSPCPCGSGKKYKKCCA